MTNAVHFKYHLATINPSGRELLFDRLLFKELMHNSGVPTPATIGYAGLEKHRGLKFDFISPQTIHEIFSKKNVTEVLVKPARGTQGKGIFIVTYNPRVEKSFSVLNSKFNTTEFFNFIHNNCANLDLQNILFEQVIRSTGLLRDLSPDASLNIRIISLRLPNGEVHITSASMRLGRANSVTSNAGSGGLLAQLDIKSGTITNCRTSVYANGEFISDHPDTHTKIIGKVIPNWHSVISTCKAAATCADLPNTIGWDILIDDHSPKILEGNDDWYIISEQIFGQGYLTDQNRELLAEYGLEFKQDELPTATLSNVKMSLLGLK